jgi:hypothetical protein
LPSLFGRRRRAALIQIADGEHRRSVDLIRIHHVGNALEGGQDQVLLPGRKAGEFADKVLL